MGILAEGSLDQQVEAGDRVGLQPLGQRLDPVQERFGLSPLVGQLKDVLPRPLGVHDLDLVVHVQEDATRLAPQPGGEVGHR